MVEEPEATRSRALTVAERKRQQRTRLRQAGLVATEVWIPKQHRSLLRRFERLLRDGIVPELPAVETATNSEERNEMGKSKKAENWVGAVCILVASIVGMVIWAVMSEDGTSNQPRAGDEPMEQTEIE